MLREFRDVASVIVRGGEPEVEPGLAELVRSVCDLDAALQMGFTITLHEVNPVEFRALSILREERDRAAEERRQMDEAKARAAQFSKGRF